MLDRPLVQPIDGRLEAARGRLGAALLAREGLAHRIDENQTA